MSYKRRANTQASADNLLQLTEGDLGCCPDTATSICRYHAEIDPEAVTVITYKDKDGNNATTAVVFTSGDDGALATALDLALRNAGLITDGTIPHIHVFTTDNDDPSVLIDIFSTVELVNIISTSGTTTFDKHCDQTVACEYQFSVEPADGMAIEVADSEDADAAPDDIAGDFGTPEDDEGDFGDEVLATFDTVYPDSVKQVIVTYNAVTDMYDVRIWLYGRHYPTVGGDDVKFCGCIMDFITEA